MRNQIVMLFALLISVASFAQKNEIKAAEKAVKKGDFAAALTQVNALDGMVSNMDDKTLPKYYYLRGETYAGLSKTDPSKENYKEAAGSFEKLFEAEEKSGINKYSTMAQPTLNTMISEVSAAGIKDYQEKNYASAKGELHQVYSMSPKDTVFLEYAANAAYLDKDYDLALDYFTELKDLGYTGIVKEYTAVNVETGERENMGTQNQMDLMVKTGTYSDPQVNVSESKRAAIVKNIAFVHVEKGDTEKAIQAVRDARAMDPKDVNLILTEANLQIKLENKEEFAKLMSEAVELDPDNPALFFNLGVISGEQGDVEKAKEYYRRAIELDPNYVDAYINLGSAMLDADKQLVEDMNKNLSNFDKYDEIKAKQVALYKEVIPLYEKAYEVRPDDLDTIRTLMSLYENTGMDDKFQSMKAKYDSLK